MRLRSGLATCAVLAAVLFHPRPAAAQGPGDTNVFGGWSFLHANDSDPDLTNFPGGFEVGLNHRLTGAMPGLTVGGKVQFSGTTLTFPGATADYSSTEFLFGVTFGPPPDAAKKAFFFGSAYIGTTRTKVAHFFGTESAGNFTFQPGAGAGVFLTPDVGLQFTGEIPIIRSEGETTTGVRLSASISIRLR